MQQKMYFQRDIKRCLYRRRETRDKNNSHVLIKAYKDQNVKGARKMQSTYNVAAIRNNH